MVNSVVEYVLDFKAEEKRTHMAVFEVEDIDSNSSTISASEVDRSECNSPTPPLFCKLRKARVMIKKLPRDVLAKYNLNTKNRSLSPLPPVRASSRIGGKQTPGIYLSLHVNKPLDEIVNKKKRMRARFLNLARQHTTKNKRKKSQKKRFVFSRSYNDGSLKTFVENDKLSGRSYNTTKPTAVGNYSSTGSVEKPRKLRHEKTKAAAKPRNVNKITPTLALDSNKHDSSTDCRSLHERIASTRLISNDSHPNNPVSSTLPNFPDVVITKYDIPSNRYVGTHRLPSTLPLSNSINTFVINDAANIPSHPSPSTPTKYIKNAIIQVPLPLATTFPNFSNEQNTQSIAYPTLIRRAPLHHKNICHPINFNTTANNASEGIYQLSNSSQRPIPVQTFAVPQHLSSTKAPVIANYPKVLIINQPSLGTDPLDMSSSAKTYNVPEKPNAGKIYNADTDMNTSVESETDLEISDTENSTDPVVIKRIIYHTKSVQTKFTCNSSICGLVDSDEFNLNCFYCYDIFPLHKWCEFKEHIKNVHRVEEKQNQSDSDEDVNISQSKNHYPISSRDISLNKENCVTKATNTTQVVKKLPLEPRLVAQRMNRTAIGSDKIISPVSKRDTSYPSKLLNQTQAESYSKRQLSNVNLKSCPNEIINLDSDDCDETNKMRANHMPENKRTATNKSNLNNNVSRIDEVSKLILPTLPHITIKKVKKVSSGEPINAPPPPAVAPSALEGSLIKFPSNTNIQKVIKTLPKPTTQQLTTNGRIRPRYFVVKKIIKLPTTETIPNINLPKEMILTKTSTPKKDNIENDCEDEDMPLNNENEDPVPKPTNGRGILFGITNTMVVIEFLLKLRTFPDLWRFQLKNNASPVCNEGLKRMCTHLNNRFDLKMTESEMRKSIQRVRNWYRQMLKNIHDHNQNPNNTEPYMHNFPLYFRVLNQYLTPDADYTYNILLNSNSNNNTNKCSKSIASHIKSPQQSTTSKANSANPDMAETLIEFDADTLYDNASSEEEFFQELNKKKLLNQTHAPKKKRKACVGNFTCDCGKTYKRIYELRRHKALHLPPQFECGICSQKFYFKRWAEKCSHLKKKKYRRGEQDNATDSPKPKRIWPKKIFRFKMICEICGASYRSIGSLNTHKRDKHLNQREKCIVCNFTALSNWRIVQHQKKRHIVEPGTVEEVAKKSRARTDTKTPFSNEARQEFFWRREMRKKLKPGEIFYGCCKCRIIFNSRKERVLHNKLEHPVKETTVICLLCLPNKLLLSNSNCARRHYTDIHKVAWHEIDDLVKRTKPIFSFLNQEEIELLKASENYKELLDELLKDKQLEPGKKVESLEDETLKAVHNLSILPNMEELDEEVNKIVVECAQEENVYVDCIIDHDYNNGDVFNEDEYVNNNEHNYSEEQESNVNYDGNDIVHNKSNNDDLFSHHTYDDGIIPLDYGIESSDNKMYNCDQEYLRTSNVDDLIEGELVEESIVVEEFIDEVADEEEEYF